jgi:hypothetical protein
MSMREYTDRAGVQWRVWRVKPGKFSGLPDRADDDAAVSDFLGERRRIFNVRPGFELGWLAFESYDERFRVTPVPDAWETLTDEELDALRLHGAKVGSPRRLIE